MNRLVYAVVPALFVCWVAWAQVPGASGQLQQGGIGAGGTATGNIKLVDDISLICGTDSDYSLGYDLTNTRLELRSSDIDGIGTDGDVWRLEDGTDDVDFIGAISVAGGGTLTGVFVNPTGSRMRQISSAGLDLISSTSMAQSAITVGATVGRHLVIGDDAGSEQDFDHAAQTDPTLFVHSATAPDTNNTQWVSMSHNQTNGVLSAGLGNIEFGVSPDLNGNDLVLDADGNTKIDVGADVIDFTVGGQPSVLYITANDVSTSKLFYTPYGHAINANNAITGSESLDTAACGITSFVTAGIDGSSITLPTAAGTNQNGCVYTIVYTGASGGALVDISPNAADSVKGTCEGVAFSGTNDADIGLTKATSILGDYIQLTSNNNDWYVTGCEGIWANN
jgi:hypothetical protein